MPWLSLAWSIGFSAVSLYSCWVLMRQVLCLRGKLPTQAAAAGGAKASTCPFAGSHVRTEQHAGVTVQVNRCPFGHGSVGVGPYPGYVHGRNPAVCTNGCVPEPQLGMNGHSQETPLQTLIREALEFQEIYHADKGSPPGVKQARVQRILLDIESTGTYSHTFDELEHGARVAWRNAPKCSNRKFHQELMVIDGRGASTPSKMFDVCLELLERATMSCATTASIAVFRPQTPGSTDGPRVWNNQLIRYAGYRQPGSVHVLGDPAEADFTQMLLEDYGWQPHGAPGRFDVLPLLLQAHPDEAPQLFELPSQYAVRVPIQHPTNEAITAMGLQWYAIPAVSNMELSVGGITYTAGPFNGWYADTEIVRNLTDEGRYNVAADVAACLRLDTRQDSSLWRDRAIVELGVAVMHSFREAGMGIVDHHTLMRSFFSWYHKEMQTRGYSPGNWKWIITPMSASTNPCYLGLKSMTEFTVKPGYWYAPGWRQYRQALQQTRELRRGAVQQDQPAEAIAVANIAVTGSSGSVMAAANSSVSVMLAYATVTFNTQQYAQVIAQVLEKAANLQVQLLNMDDFDADSWSATLGAAQLVLLLTSTYGAGACPSSATKFLAWLKTMGKAATNVLYGKPFCVLGFGSSSYPRFCAAADCMHAAMLAATGSSSALLPPAKADAVVGEEGVVWPWARQLAAVMHEKGWLADRQAAEFMGRTPAGNASTGRACKRLYDLFILEGDSLQPPREHGGHWATVRSVTEFLGPASKSAASIKLLLLDIWDTPCSSYLPGDEVAVWGVNDPQLVVDFGANLGIPKGKLDTLFMLQSAQDDTSPDCSPSTAAPAGRFPQPNTFRTVLAQHLGLAERLRYCDLSMLAQYAPQDSTLQQLATSQDEFTDWAAELQCRWMDLFELFPSLAGRIPLETFFSVAPLMKPRYYSVASSPAANPGQLALVVGQYQYSLPSGETRQGFCSSFLAGLTPGSKLRFKIASQPAFRLPFNSASPVVMIAAGTGIAPFRGFWEERAFRQQQGQQLGPAVLLFGCRSPSGDFLLKSSLEQLVQQGVLSNVLTAYSRTSGLPKTYVQDLIHKHTQELCPLLLHPKCHVYICGSNGMAQGVSKALESSLGKDAFAVLVEEGRLHEEIFGSACSTGATAMAPPVRVLAQYAAEV